MPLLLVAGRWLVRDARSGPAGLLPRGAVLVDEGRIVAVDHVDAFRGVAAELIDRPDGLVLPGLINAHHHGRALGPSATGGQDGPLELWMFQPAAWGALPTSSNRLLTLARQLLSGVTSSLEAHMARGPIAVYRTAVEEALAAYLKSGTRVALTLGLQDRNRFVYDDSGALLASLPAALRALVVDPADVAADDYVDLLAELRTGVDHARVRLFVGSTAPQWLSDEGLRRCAAAAERDDVGIHLHLNETVYERAHGPRAYGESVVQHLDRLGILSGRFSGAHGVWLDPPDMDLLAARAASVVHNPSSNLRLCSGIAPVRALVDAGVNVALGMDSNSFADDDDMFAEMRLAHQLHRGHGVDSGGLSAYQVLAMATTGGARVLGRDDLGVLRPGARGDVVVVRMARAAGPALGALVDPVETLVARAQADDVGDVLVDGQPLVRDGTLVHLDLAEIERQVAQELAERCRSVPFARLAAPQAALHERIRAFYAGWHAG